MVILNYVLHHHIQTYLYINLNYIQRYFTLYFPVNDFCIYIREYFLSTKSLLTNSHHVFFKPYTHTITPTFYIVHHLTISVHPYIPFDPI